MKNIKLFLLEKLKVNSKSKINDNIKLIEKYPNNKAAEYGDVALEYLCDNGIDISEKDIIAIDLNSYHCMTIILKNDLTDKFKDFEFYPHCNINILQNANKRFGIDEKCATFIDLAYKQLKLEEPKESDYLRLYF